MTATAGDFASTHRVSQCQRQDSIHADLTSESTYLARDHTHTCDDRQSSVKVYGNHIKYNVSSEERSAQNEKLKRLYTEKYTFFHVPSHTMQNNVIS